MHHGHSHSPQVAPRPQLGRAPRFWRSRYAIGLVVLGAIAAYFLLSEHRAHVFGALPFLLLLACPFMHVFMHHGHGDHHGSAPTPAQKPGEQP